MLSIRGQVLALAVIILSIILAELSIKTLVIRPVVVNYRGELISAEIIQLSRIYVANRSRGGKADMNYLLQRLLEYNRSLNLGFPNITFDDVGIFFFLNTSDSYGKGAYVIVWNLRFREFNYTVIFNVTWCFEKSGYYIKDRDGLQIIYVNYTLFYVHEYYAPQWGRIVIFPMIYSESADILLKGDGIWFVGIPLNSTPSIFDIYGIKINIGGKVEE
ncbi:MAG: hypothetical protein DRJ32_00445 [Thermoprotei archaeon]|nr:MAG: hypothetical protein DRJ32_00445 [Thermoprotei archaeon]